MVMVTHQDVCMDFPTGALANLSQSLNKTEPIRIVFKDIFTPISPTHHMISSPLELHPYFPSHMRLLPATRAKGKKKGLTPFFPFRFFIPGNCLSLCPPDLFHPLADQTFTKTHNANPLPTKNVARGLETPFTTMPSQM